MLVLLVTGDPASARRFAPAVLWATPLLAVLAIGVFVRAPPERKAHRASRIGIVLAGVALVMWLLVLIPTLRAPAA